MKTLVSFIAGALFVFCWGQIRADIVLPGGPISGNLSNAGSPYYVMGDLIVECNKTLYVQGGVTIIFEGDFSIHVYGCIKAMGSDESPILFTTGEGVTHWGGVNIYGNHRCPDLLHSRIQYVTFERAWASGGPDMWDHSGGALYIAWDDNVEIRNCLFRDNYAVGGLPGESLGGGAIAMDKCDIEIEYCQFANNHCDKYGGAIGLRNASPVMKYNIFFENSAAMLAVGGGAALFMQGECNPVSQNDSYLNNTTLGKGGLLYADGDSDPSFMNSLCWGNEADEGDQMYLASNGCDPNVEYSNFEGGKAAIAGPGGGFAYLGKWGHNIDKQPSCNFTTQNEYLYCLNKCSCCIDAGNPANNYCDPDGTIADMGAMYFSHEGTYIQKSEVDGVWESALAPYWVNNNLVVPEDGRLIIDQGVEVVVLQGYKVEVKGSLVANGTASQKVHFRADDRACGWKGIRFLPESANAEPSRLDHCVIENSVADGPEATDKMGGGVLIWGNDKVTLVSCEIKNNRTTEMQGQYTGGAGVAIKDCSPLLKYNMITDNSAAEFGGGIGIFNGSPKMHHNYLKGNTAGIGGGAMCISAGSSPKITNFTMIYNQADQVGGGLLVSEDSDPVVTNTILFYNTAKYGNQVYINDLNSDPDFYYNDIEGALKAFKGYGTLDYTGDYLNNLDADPGFKEGSILLAGWSPCIDAGDPLSRPDMDGSRADMGAYSFDNRYLESALGTGPSQRKEGSWLNIHPIPTIDFLNVEINSEQAGALNVEVFNLLGQVVSNYSADVAANVPQRVRMNVSELAPGNYIVVSRVGNYINTTKIIKR